jgi:hypothetical protein
MINHTSSTLNKIDEKTYPKYNQFQNTRTTSKQYKQSKYSYLNICNNQQDFKDLFQKRSNNLINLVKVRDKVQKHKKKKIDNESDTSSSLSQTIQNNQEEEYDCNYFPSVNEVITNNYNYEDKEYSTNNNTKVIKEHNKYFYYSSSRNLKSSQVSQYL